MRRLSVAEKETRAKSTFIQIDPQIRLKILLFNRSNKVAKKKKKRPTRVKTERELRNLSSNLHD